MRLPRDFRRGEIYGVTQRGNNGQWVYLDDEDFRKGLDLMRKYTARYDVLIHGWCLLHNHGHWIFEASDEDSISNLMRDMQGQYSRYLNSKYRKRPAQVVGKLGKEPREVTPYFKAGPVNWTPRFDSEHLVGASFPAFLRYMELNPVRAKMKRRAEDWPWSSAVAHLTGVDKEGLLSLEKWQLLFGGPDKIAEEWRGYLEAPILEEQENLVRVRTWSGSAHNRPTQWFPPEVAATADTRPG